MERIDPNLNEEFIDYLADAYPDAMWSTTYVHWHESVSEYCVYINAKWCGYVPEEYIFKAGFDLYKQWSDAWIRSKNNEIYFDLTRRYMQTCLEFCEEKGHSESAYMDGIRWFVRVVRHHRVLPKDIQDQALTYMLEWCTKYDYMAGAEYLEKELVNGGGDETPRRL